MEHKCERGIDTEGYEYGEDPDFWKSIEVYKRDGIKPWILQFGEYRGGIRFCPFCGERLEKGGEA